MKNEKIIKLYITIEVATRPQITDGHVCVQVSHALSKYLALCQIGRWERGDPEQLDGPRKLSATIATAAAWNGAGAQQALPAFLFLAECPLPLGAYSPNRQTPVGAESASPPPCLRAGATCLRGMRAPLQLRGLPPDVYHP